MKTYENLQITPVFKETYSPNYMPIETIFSQVKQRFKEQRLNRLANGKKIFMDELIRQAFGQVQKREILNAIDGSMKLLGVK